MIRVLAAVALVGGSVWTGEGPPIDGATVLIEGNRVVAVGADADVEVPADARRIDVSGRVVTPGLVASASRIGLSEVLLEASAVEATLPADAVPVRASLRAADTWNPVGQTVEVARRGGITSAEIAPRGGVVSGLAAWVDLVADESVREGALALHVRIAPGEEAGGRAEAFWRLRRALEDARLFRANRGAYISARLRPLELWADDAEVLAQVLDGEMPVAFHVDRASDIRTVLAITRDFSLRAVLVGAAEGWRVADALARARVPVLVNPFDNLPASFDRLFSRSDNAARLARAGVVVGLALPGASHLAGRLRHAAGRAVVYGLSREQALAAITRVPAQAFGRMDTGTLARGSLANLVVWNGDPFEVTTWPTQVWIRGVEQPLETRQDLLTERYR